MGISATIPCRLREDFGKIVGRVFRSFIVCPILFNPLSVDLSIITCKKILCNTGNGFTNSHLILSCFMQLGPGPGCGPWYGRVTAVMM